MNIRKEAQNKQGVSGSLLILATWEAEIRRIMV
jgi:hypothetical protein